MVYLRSEDCQAHHEGCMQRILWIEGFNWSRRPLRQPPEWLTIFSLSIERISVQQLHDIVSVVLIEFSH